MVRLAQIFAVSAAAALLSACHVSTKGSSGPPQSMTPQPGQLLQTPSRTGSYSPSDLLSMLSGNGDTGQLLKLAFNPLCTVNVYHMKYETVGGQGEATTEIGRAHV